MIYTASYFQPEFHHGKLISISQTIPKGFRVDSQLDFLAPSQSLLAEWKAENITQQQYTELYRVQIQQSWKQVKGWLDSLTTETKMTLLCWERANSFCHRDLVAKLVKMHRPECFRGCDVLRVEVDKCPKCASEMIPGLDYSFCPKCRSWSKTS